MFIIKKFLKRYLVLNFYKIGLTANIDPKIRNWFLTNLNINKD